MRPNRLLFPFARNVKSSICLSRGRIKNKAVVDLYDQKGPKKVKLSEVNFA